MKYKYNYRTNAFELWQLSMYYIYGSVAGVCNIVFTVAMFALTVSKWKNLAEYWHFLMILGCLFFPLIQPLIIYKRVQEQAKNEMQDTEISFYESGISVSIGEQNSEIKWNKVKGIIKKPTMLILLSGGKYGFIFSNRVLGSEKEEFYQYVNSKIAEN